MRVSGHYAVLRRARYAAACGVVLLAATAASAAGEITAEDPWMQPALRPGAAVAVYMTLRNAAAAADRCRVVDADITPTLQFHETVNVGDIMRMKPLDALDVPANGTAALTPGAVHIMLTGVLVPLKAGDTVRVTLECEHGGALDVPVQVVPFGSR